MMRRRAVVDKFVKRRVITCDGFRSLRAVRLLIRATQILQRQVHSRRTWVTHMGMSSSPLAAPTSLLDPVMNVWDCAALLPIVEELEAHLLIGKDEEQFMAATRSRLMELCSNQ